MVKGWSLLELLLPEEREKLRNFITLATEYVGEPIIIVLPKSALHVWYLFWVICRELYREARGSYPEPVILFKLKSEPTTKSKANCVQRLEYWLKLYRSFSGKLVILDDECIEDEHVKELFERRLKETFSQGLGFIIVLARDTHETEELIKELCKPYIPKVFSIERIPEEGFMLERLSKTMSSLFGLPVRLERLSKLDTVVAEVDRRYRDFINKLLLSDYMAYVKRDVSARESEDHIALKILAIRVLVEEYGIRPENICCTCPIDENVVPDIYVENRGLVVECETMFEVAPTPLIKIFETVRKYLNLNPSKPVNEIWVIIRNWPALIHLGDLIWIESILREEFKRSKKNVNVRFFVPDIHRKTIRALDNIVNASSIPVPGGGMPPRA
jgi:adenylate kinase family enzyme